MNADLLALARRAVACKGWRWMPGMRTTMGERMSDDGWPMYETLDHGSTGVVESVEWRERVRGGSFPDFTDPATLGCLLALVREAWTSPHASVLSPKAHDSKHPGLIGRWVVRSGGVLCFSGATEAEALVTALEAAP